MRLHTLGALAALTIAAAGMSACQTNIGKAASVDGHSITESSVNGYLTADSKPLTLNGGSQVQPRAFVLSTLIQERIFEQALQTHGGEPDASDIAAARTNVLNGESEDQLVKDIVKAGFASSFEPAFLRTQALSSILQSRATAGGTAAAKQITSTIAKVPVSVSPRYGGWDASTISVSGNPAQSVSSFVKLAGS